MMHMIACDAVVAHTAYKRGPSPSDAYARIVYVRHLIVGYSYVVYISRSDAYTTPIFVGSIGYRVGFHEDVVAYVTIIVRQIWDMGLKSSVRECPYLYGCSADIGECAFCHITIRISCHIIKACGCEMCKQAVVEIYSRGIADCDCSLRSGNPSLVLKLGFLRQSRDSELICINEPESALKCDMSFHGRTQP